MKYITTVVVVALAVAGMWIVATPNAYAETVSVGPTARESSFAPVLPDFFPTKEFLGGLAALFPDNPGVAETKFWESRELYELCSNPRVIGFPERDVGRALLAGYDCFIFYGGDVERLQPKRTDVEHIRHRGMDIYMPRDATIIVFGGEYRDMAQFPGARLAAAGTCDRCSAGDGAHTTSCVLKDTPAKPVCSVVRYADIPATVISGKTYQRSLANCGWYVEGAWSGTADTCYIKASGGGKINADCFTRFGIDARDGDFTIFLGNGDGFVNADTNDTIYAGEGVNLLFVKDAGGRARIVKPREDMPCLRIIPAE